MDDKRGSGMKYLCALVAVEDVKGIVRATGLPEGAVRSALGGGKAG